MSDQIDPNEAAEAENNDAIAQDQHREELEELAAENAATLSKDTPVEVAGTEESLDTNPEVTTEEIPVSISNESVLNAESEKKVMEALARGETVNVSSEGDATVMVAESDLPHENDTPRETQQLVQEPTPTEPPRTPSEEVTQYVSLAAVLSDRYGMPQDAATRFLRDSKITFGGEEVKIDRTGVVPLSDIKGKEIVIEGELRTVKFEHNS